MPIYRSVNGNWKETVLAYSNGAIIPQIYYGDKLVHDNPGVIFESSTGGEHTVKIPYTGTYSIRLVGAGGGGAFSRTQYNRSAKLGGSGSMIYGNITLQSGVYTVTVGTGGNPKTAADSAYGATADDGTSTEAFGQVAGGGFGAYAFTRSNLANGGHNGYGGIPTASEGLTTVDGVDGDTTGVYENGYGAGGTASTGGSAQRGNDGYLQIVADWGS